MNPRDDHGDRTPLRDVCRTIAAIREVQARGGPHDHSDASDGPGERVLAPADLDAMADRECDRDERMRWAG